MSRRAVRALLVCLALHASAAKLPWDAKPPENWTEADARRVLEDSPWAQRAEAAFPDPRDHDSIPAQSLPGPAQAGMAGSRGVSDGKWDGGVGSNRNGAGLPSLQVLVRWESSEPVREAMARLAALRKAQPKLADKGDPNQTYIIAVQGLLPAHPTEASPSLETSSSSDASHSAGAMTEQILESFMAKSSLGVRSGTFVRPQNVQIEAETGVVRLFFPVPSNLAMTRKLCLQQGTGL